MYLDHFGLREKPFALTPDPKFLFMTEQHLTALSLLEYSVLNQAGFVVITGHIGAGKTTLLKQLLKSLDKRFIVGNVAFTHTAFGNLMQWISDAFGLPETDSDDKCTRQLFRFLQKKIQAGERLLLVVDEAQNLSEDLLEQLRLLSNFNHAGEPGLQMILAGQPELKQRLQSPKLVQFAQRISVDYHLTPLSADQACDYIDFRIEKAGGRADIFSDKAKRVAAYYGRGVPRLINNICDMALVYAFGGDEQQVTLATVKEVVKDRKVQSVVNVFDDDPPQPLM